MKAHPFTVLGIIAAIVSPALMSSAASSSPASTNSKSTPAASNITITTTNPPGTTKDGAADKATDPSNTGHTYSSANSNYIIHSGDILHIEVTGDPNATRDPTVDIDGTVPFAYLDKSIKVSGMTIEAAKDLISGIYKKEEMFVNPNVIIRVTQYAEQRINILGQVNKPGPVVIPPNQKVTLVGAVTMAGGHTRIASHSCTITHKGPDGKTVNSDVNLYEAMLDSKKDVDLEDGDTVLVHESPFGWID